MRVGRQAASIRAMLCSMLHTVAVPPGGTARVDIGWRYSGSLESNHIEYTKTLVMANVSCMVLHSCSQEPACVERVPFLW